MDNPSIPSDKNGVDHLMREVCTKLIRGEIPDCAILRVQLESYLLLAHQILVKSETQSGGTANTPAQAA